MSIRTSAWIVGLAASFVATQAQAVLIESWENSANGWTISAENSAYTISGFSTTTGVTEGSYSMEVTGTASPTYGQMLNSPSTLANTAAIAGAESISIDIFTPPGSFGFFQQWLFAINNADTGFVQFNGGSYLSTTIGSETTLTFNITPAVRATLATSTNPTLFIYQVGGGFTEGNETFYVDNLRTTLVPEPGAATLLGIAGLAMVGFVRRRCRQS